MMGFGDDGVHSPQDVLDLPPGTKVRVGGRVRVVRRLGSVTFWSLWWEGAAIQVVVEGSSPVGRFDVVEILATVASHSDRTELVLQEIVRHHQAHDRQPSADMHLLETDIFANLHLRAQREGDQKEVGLHWVYAGSVTWHSGGLGRRPDWRVRGRIL